jgi:hypothetical protein
MPPYSFVRQSVIARCSPLLVSIVLVVRAAVAHSGEPAAPGVHQRSLDEIKKTLSAILAAGSKDSDEKAPALRRLQAYRYLAEVPYADLTLDDDYNAMCLAGARLCQSLGKLEHTPKNPGLPEDEFRVAYKGTSRSNLAWGRMTLPACVDGWMFDSDSANIDRLGHRRWCLFPAMQKTGFGRVGAFAAMYVFDRGRADVPAYDYVCFPARGYMPIEFFSPAHAWSVSLNPQKYQTPSRDFVPKIYQADAGGGKQGQPLRLGFKNIDSTPFGIANCIIFRPEAVEVTPGKRYVVELEGIARRAEGDPVTMSYVVEFAR